MLFIVSLIFIIQFVESAGKNNSPSIDFFQGPELFKRGTRTTNFDAAPVHQTLLSKDSGQQENDVDGDKTFCPANPHKMPFFGFKCRTNEDCVVPGEICCQQSNFKICRRAIPKRYRDKLDIRTKSYQPNQRRLCPSREAFVEMLPVQNCTDDSDCGLWRICCPDGDHSYCRRAVPQLDLIFSAEITKTFNSMMSYLQCTSPPPPLLDFFAKPCKNVLDCFPNLCCQEQGRKVCRPSRRSLFPLLTIPT